MNKKIIQITLLALGLSWVGQQQAQAVSNAACLAKCKELTTWADKDVCHAFAGVKSTTTGQRVPEQNILI